MAARKLTGRGTVFAAVATVPMLLAAPAVGQQALDWVEKPSPLDLRAAYPAKALADGVDARVTLKCDVRNDGRVEACGVAGEEPGGYGFGASALMLAPKFRLALNDEVKPGGVVNIPIRFARAGDPPLREAVFKKPTGDYRKLIPAGPFWPEKALKQGKGGEAVVDCVVEPDGRLSSCAHVSGEPHFGGSTLRMAAAGWMMAAPLPAGATPAPENVYRFRVVFPARRIADTAPPGG
jgi:TonB family protein